MNIPDNTEIQGIIRQNSPGANEFSGSVLIRRRLQADDSIFRGPKIDVRSYGAVGDGTQDDTVAIQTAITAAHAGKKSIVYLPPGNYKITDTLSIPSGTGITGDNPAINWDLGGVQQAKNTFITFNPGTSTKDLFHVTGTLGSDAYYGGINLSDLYIVGTNTGTGTPSTYCRYALNLSKVAHSYFRRVSISRFQAGFYMIFSMTNHFDFCSMDSCNVADFIYDATYTNGVPDMTSLSTSDVWNHCIFHGSTNNNAMTPWAGIIKFAYGITFIAPLFEALKTGALAIYSECLGIEVLNQYLEATPNPGAPPSVPIDETQAAFWVGGNYGGYAPGVQLTISGGLSIGPAAGTWLKAEKCSGVRVFGGTVRYYTKGIDAGVTDDCINYAVGVFGPTFDTVTTPILDYNGGKVWGVYPTTIQSGAISPLLKATNLNLVQTINAGTITPDKYFIVQVLGVPYKVPCVAV
jgi:hypothetical protein